MSGERRLADADPAEAFAALADPTRVAILRALWEAEDEPLSFSALRDAVGMADSGQFNYHLSKLVGRFVSKDEDGYQLRLAGRHVVGGLLAGAYTTDGNLDPIPLSRPCPYCGGERTFHYEDERVRTDCDGCDAVMAFDVPPGTFEGYDHGAIPGVADRYLRGLLYRAITGICHVCNGRISPQVLPDVGMDDPNGDLPEALREVPLLRFDCDRCGHQTRTDLGLALVTHPAVVAFFHDQGADPREEPLIRFATGGDGVTVLESEPLRVAVTFEEGGKRLRVEVDESFDVLETERESLN